MRDRPAHQGFTLIELLIVVAIIAILAAIAVPNFLEAQTRSKVSRAKADMRSIVTALESYAVDNNRYPIDRVGVTPAPSGFGLVPPNLTPPLTADDALHQLTTPISYMSSIPANIFPNETDNPMGEPQYRYFGDEWKSLVAIPGNPLRSDTGAHRWTLVTTGPDHISNLGEYLIFGVDIFEQQFPNGFPAFNAGPTVLYDPTNGTISSGDIAFVGPGGLVN